MDSASENTTAPAAHTTSDLRWLVLFGGGMLLAGAACWFGYPLAVHAYKSWQVSGHLAAAQQQVAAKQWGQAAAALREARTLAPDDPSVLRASLEFLKATGADPRGGVSLGKQLQQSGNATAADLVTLGQMHARLGEIQEAQSILAKLPEADRQTAAGRQLQAALLTAAGQQDEANRLRRSVLQERQEQPDSLRELARLEMNEAPPARRQAMRTRLWDLAHRPGPTQTTAVEILCRDTKLTVPQLVELRQIFAALPASVSREELDMLFFRLASAQMRLHPDTREETLAQEILRWKDRPPAQARPLVAWLAEEGEHARLLRLVPPALAVKFADLLPFYMEALRQTEQWGQMASLLSTSTLDVSTSKTDRLLWQAEARAHLDATPERARQLLARALEEAGRGDNLTQTLRCGEVAERLSWWDLARQCYSVGSEKHANVRTTLLLRVYQMAEHQRDGEGMLQACTRLAELRQNEATTVEQKLYLQALLGVHLETAGRQLADLGNSPAPARAGQRHLISALLAFRQGRSGDIQTELGKIKDPTLLAAGERAVYAGLLKSSGGDAATAFRLIEKVPPALLLPEESRFAQRAL